jgi:beta-lactam-binding protein with PASTA domain
MSKEPKLKKHMTREEARQWLEAKGILKKLTSEELEQRIKNRVPGTYIYKGITYQIGGTNPFEPE